MFVKVKSYMATSEISFTKKALKYQYWQQQVRLGRQHDEMTAADPPPLCSMTRQPLITLHECQCCAVCY